MTLASAADHLTAARRAFGQGAWDAVRDAVQAAGPAAEADAESQAMLAWACRELGDGDAAAAAVDRALLADARNLRACLVKADLLFAAGARREANLFYRAVVEIGGAASGLPPELGEGVRRARTLRESLAGDIFAHLREDLEEAGYRETASTARFTHALDLATGRKQAYFQQPQAFFFPELPHTQFFPRDMFPWLETVEAATDAMTGELEGLLAGDAGFTPYLQSLPNMPMRPDYPLVDSLDWSAAFLWKDGRETENAARCPQTMAALADVPLCRIEGRSPQVMFSQLKAGAHIKPHTGFVNTRLVCHVPLIVPPNCKFRVGNEVRSWKKGEAWVFDDTIEHEAINESDRTRVVLIFDIWRPELTEEERRLVATLLESMDAYSPRITAWE